jgi:hypothetical protein
MIRFKKRRSRANAFFVKLLSAETDYDTGKDKDKERIANCTWTH